MLLTEHLWNEYRARLRAYIAKRVRDAHAVDDLLQEVFVKAHKNLTTVKAAGSISAWLFRIASNVVAEHYRSQKPWEPLPQDLPAPGQEFTYAAELTACLRPLISGLPERYQTALILSDLDGLPQKAVAERLGISLSGAKSRVQRGREKLREQLLRCCDIELGHDGVMGYERRGNHAKSRCGG